MLICLIFIATSVFTFIHPAEAISTSFTVHNNEEVTKVLSLKVEDHIFIHFTVVGATSENTIQFILACPNGTEKDFGKTGDFHYTFVCDLEGDYILRFSNIGSSVDKLVTLDYEVEHYIFGIPQMLFLTIIIAVTCVIAVASYIFLSKTH
jgi:hypothetical protein